MPVTLRSALPGDTERIARILIEVRSAFMPYAPLAHAPHEVRDWVRAFLVPSGGSVVAELDDTVVGVMATEREELCSWITQMAVDPGHVGVGIGSALLEHAFRMLPSPIRLYTFQANHGARRFYERHGFRAMQLSDGSANEERCPDVLYEFKR
jgi:ribosomal protein S18 acetylase RimI-like enzyme